MDKPAVPPVAILLGDKKATTPKAIAKAPRIINT